ncbi:subunit 4 of RNA polymerase II transcription factor B [Chloropicon primus]|uniref:General transcription and DNA repair factor IIH subunit TFB4 n=1 Tax=Chloropicon primus TaxID=1764295 RepID=A0A5B8MXJ9_9CHLO|nr:subunit 4 of RNA polymerase II transcription factor B [Chloropicon primus]|eukprot:QDZ25303.1 subunit 4 of RNA polymerase II transcription factor B [Chloropicon primus]
MEEETALVIVVDASLFAWHCVQGKGKEDEFTLGDLVEHLHVFLNALVLVRSTTKVGIVVMNERKASLLPLRSLGRRCLCVTSGGVNNKDEDEMTTRGRGKVLEDLKTKLLGLIEREYFGDGQEARGGGLEEGKGCALSSAYSKCLCLLRRHLESCEEEHGLGYGSGPGEVDLEGLERQRRTRVLFLHGSQDVASQYIQVMNASFCAQRLGTVVDTFMLGRRDSSFLQQAASITGGLYTNFFADAASKDIKKFSLSTYLIQVFLADSGTRADLQLPQGHSSASLKVTCFLTKKALDIGFVCSVCLSIFNQKLQTCAVCGTEFSDNRALKKKVLSRQG